MANFLDTWFFDWMSVTIPNGTDGKGRKSEGLAGDREMKEGAKRIFSWVTVNGLRMSRIGKGTDGYAAGAHFASDPTSRDRLATIRDGHATNMPNVELPGASGVCAELAPKLLRDLGPVLVARADVSRDVSQEGLFDELHELCFEFAASRGMKNPTLKGSVETGRTIEFGSGENSVKIYEKDFERAAKNVISIEDVDPHLVRTEFTFRPVGAAKAGMANIAREHGPGALIGTCAWVREFVKRIAVITAAARAEEAEIGVTRVDRTPDARTIREKADHASAQYARTHCRAAVRDMVMEDWDSDWEGALIDPDDVVSAVLKNLLPDIEEAAMMICDDYGVLEVRDHEEEAERAQLRLNDYIKEQAKLTRHAQAGLAKAEAEARARSGVKLEVAA